MSFQYHTPRSSSSVRTVGSVRNVRIGGREWTVREVVAPEYDRRAGTNLIFEAIDVVRRVRNFPENWRELSDPELAELSRRV
jgi:hypothetical protein